MKATTRTSAPGNRPRVAAAASAGFSLLELMVVVLLVAIATGLVALSMRDSSDSKLEEEGARLSALLESARTQSRVIGTDVRWQPVATGGFQFLGLSPLATLALPTHWLDEETRADVVGTPQLRLGPEPLLPAQRVVLHLRDRQIAVGSDGLAPFQIVEDATAAAAR